MATTPTSFNSGMTDSFHQAVPKVGLPPGTATSAPPTTNANSFSTPMAAAAKPATGVTGPTATPAVPVTGGKANFSMTIPGVIGAASSVGGAINRGYNAYQNMGMIDKVKSYLGASSQVTNPDGTSSRVPNFANIMGAMAPISGPLLRTAGLPLMLGAYSFLKDPNYLSDLSNGKVPKMGLAGPAPKALSSNFDIQSPALLGTMSQAGTPDLPGAIRKQVTPVVNPPADPTGLSQKAKTLIAHTGGLGAGMYARKAVPGISGALTGLEMTGAIGDPNASWRDIAQRHQESLNPAQWLQNFHTIHNNPNSGMLDKVFGHANNAIGNPYTQMVLDPVGNALSAVKGVDDITGASNLVHWASNGRFGTKPEGNTMSVPAAIGSMFNIGQPERPRRVAVRPY